jgi:hypothetical protein
MPLGEGLRQPVGQRLEQDRPVVVVRRLEARDALVDAVPGRHGEGADPVAQPAASGATKSARHRFGWPGALRFCSRKLVQGQHRARSSPV